MIRAKKGIIRAQKSPKTIIGSRKILGLDPVLIAKFGSGSSVARPIYRFWRQKALIETPTLTFESFLLLHGTPFRVLAAHLEVSRRRLRAMWVHFRFHNPRARHAWHWTNPALPVDLRVAFIAMVKRSLDRVPDKSFKVRPSAELVNRVDAHLAPAIDAHAQLLSTDADSWPVDKRPLTESFTRDGYADAADTADTADAADTDVDPRYYQHRTTYHGTT